MRYELFISLRYLRAKRREAFISLITLISILGVTISVMTLDVLRSTAKYTVCLHAAPLIAA